MICDGRVEQPSARLPFGVDGSSLAKSSRRGLELLSYLSIETLISR